MKRADVSLTIALCLSLLLHGLGFVALAEKYAGSLYSQLAALNATQPQKDANGSNGSDGPAVRDKTPAMPIIQALPKPPKGEDPIYEEVFGEKHAKGDALNNTNGVQPMKAHQADEVQAYVSHDPVPNPGPGAPVKAMAGEGGNGGNGGRPGGRTAAPSSPSQAANSATPRPRIGSPEAAVAMLTRQTEDPAPLGLPPTAAPPPPMSPRPFRVVRPNSIAINDPMISSPPTTQVADEHPPTTQSVAIDEKSPTTAPVAEAPTTKPSVKVAIATPPSKAPTLRTATTHPAEQVASIVPPVTTPPTTEPVGLPPTSKAKVVDAPFKPTTAPAVAETTQKQPATLPVTVAMAPASELVPSADQQQHATAQAAPQSPPTPSPAPAPVPTGGGIPGTPGVAARGGDGGNQGETESDPFSKDINIAFVNGKVVARDGRHVKSYRPHLTMAGEADAYEGHNMVVLAARIDETGKVTDVKVAKSSGSNQVDLPAYNCLWKWEFDPTLDKSGKAIPDVLIIPFVWR